LNTFFDNQKKSRYKVLPAKGKHIVLFGGFAKYFTEAKLQKQINPLRTTYDSKGPVNGVDEKSPRLNA
jgi:hypothetical protein